MGDYRATHFRVLLDREKWRKRPDGYDINGLIVLAHKNVCYRENTEGEAKKSRKILKTKKYIRKNPGTNNNNDDDGFR
jgi:hypothetical protein